MTDIAALLGDSASDLLEHTCSTVPADSLTLPGPDFVERVFVNSDRSPQVLRSLQGLFSHGRLGGSGYVSILPVDQGIEHSGAASFAPNPSYFNPSKIVELAIEGGCNAVATTYGVLGWCSRQYARLLLFPRGRLARSLAAAFGTTALHPSGYAGSARLRGTPYFSIKRR